MKKFFLLQVTILASIVSFAQTPVWSTDVAPILYNRCTSCHHSSGIAPFSLVTYNQALSQAASIKSDVNSGKMPPWPPSPAYSHFAHERVLSPGEITTITNWVNGGAPSGDTTLAPPVPVYSTTGVLPGTPDLIIKIPTYTSTASTGDVYQCFAIPSGLLVDKHIIAMEALPGNPQIVHHVQIFADTTGACANLDSLSAGPGFPGLGASSSGTTLLGVWVPGSAPMVYPSGFSMKMYHHTDIVLEVHYPAGTAGMVDSTEVHFFFAPTATPRELFVAQVLNTSHIDSSLFIPANTTKTFHETYPIVGNYSILAVFPHMHLIGKSINAYGVRSTGDTDRYISIPDWNFHWQGFYTFPRFIKVPTGTTFHSDALYDNTTANPDNPHSPPVNVTEGPNTTDEMMLTYFLYTAYQAGDENIIIDSAVALGTPNELSHYYHGQQLLDVYPNPATGDIVIKCFFENNDVATVDLVDMQGKIVKRLKEREQVNKGYGTTSCSLAGLPNGLYILRMQTSERVLTRKVIVSR